MEDDDLEFLNNARATPKKGGKKKASPKKTPSKRSPAKKTPSKKTTKKKVDKKIVMPTDDEVRDADKFRSALKKGIEAEKIWKRSNAEAIQRDKERKEAQKNRVFLTMEEVAVKRSQIDEEERKKMQEIKEYIENYQGITIPKEALDRIFHKPIDNSKGIQILEPDVPVNIRDQTYTAPLSFPQPPPFYKGNIRYGDTIDFYFTNGFETEEIRGRIHNFRSDGFEILGFNGMMYVLPYDDESIVIRSPFLKKTSFKSETTLTDFIKTKVREEDDAISIRTFTVRMIMTILFDVITNLVGEKIPTLKELGMTEEESKILRKHMLRFDDNNVSCIYKPVKGNDYVKGVWEYVFWFNGAEVREEILVPPFMDEKEKSPMLEESFFMIEFKKWLYLEIFHGRGAEDVIALAELAKKMEEEQYAKFNDLNFIVDLILSYLGHHQDNIYFSYPAILLNKMRESSYVGRLSDKDIENIAGRTFKEYEASKIKIREKIKKYELKKDVNGINYYMKTYNDINKTKEEIIKIMKERRDSVKSIHKYYYLGTLIAYIQNKLDSMPHDTTGDKLLIGISVAVEDFMRQKTNYLSGDKDRETIQISITHELITEYIKNFTPKNPHFSFYFNKFDASHRKIILAKYEQYFSDYLKAKQKFDAAAGNMKEYTNILKKGREKVEKAYGSGYTGRSDFLNLVITHEYKQSDITKKGYDILYEIKEYENKCFQSIKESERSVAKYMKTVLYPFLFLQGTFKKHTKQFQKMLDTRQIHLKNLLDMQFEDFFPEIAMQFSGENALDKRVQERIKERLKTDANEFIQKNIENYIFSLDRSYVKSINYIPGEDFWARYVTSVPKKCSDIMKEDISAFTREDTTVYYDTFTNSFVCYNIKEVLKDIEETDVYIENSEDVVYKDKRGKPYPPAFIKKMKKLYKDLEIEEEASSSKNINLYFIYENQVSDIYKNFIEDIDKLYEKYSNINIIIKHKKDAMDIVKKTGVLHFPVVLCLFGESNDLLFKTNTLENLLEQLDKATRVGYIQEGGDENVITYNVNKDFRDIGKEKLIEYIQEEKLPFPYAFYYMEDPSTFVGYKPYARMAKLATKKAGEYGKVLVYDDNDYEKLDILTNYFTEKARVLGVFSKNGNTKSLLELWKERASDVVDKAYSYADAKKIKLNAKALREGIYLSGVPECTNFKISSAIAIYNEFKPKVTLDPFSGWGDRALGALFSNTVEHYIGVDPNSLLREGYEKIENYGKEFFPSKKLDFIHSTIEDFDYDSYVDGKEIDLIFSSPPYYNYEVYTEEGTQSIQKFSSEKEWTTWFHKQTYLLFKKLKKGGHLVYYLGTCGNLKIPQNLISFMEKNFGKSVYKGSMPTQSKDKKKRPLYYYVWQKN